jgi:RND superfamily putative drug exporter
MGAAARKALLIASEAVLERFARYVIHHRKLVVGAWIVLTLFGAFSAKQVSTRWLEQFSIPGYSAYETNQTTLKAFGNGEDPPHVVVITAKGDVTKERQIAVALDKVHRRFPKFRISSYFDTHSLAYVSKNRHTTFAEVYPSGQQGFSPNTHTGDVRDLMQQSLPGLSVHLTGRDALNDASGGSGPSVVTEALIGGGGALIILMFVFGTLPAILMPIAVAIASILNTFTLIWFLTYLTPVSLIVQFLVALVGLGVAIDYALLMIFRFREELRHGSDPETATIETMKHAGRSVVVSGSTVAIGLLSMVIIPVPVIRSIGIAGMLIPAVSVLAAITMLPAALSLLGHRINSVRVMPKRIVEGSDLESGFWWRWAHLVMRRPLLIGGIGVAIVALLLVGGVQLNAAEAQAKDLPGKGDAFKGLRALDKADISAGVLKPFDVLLQLPPFPGNHYPPAQVRRQFLVPIVQALDKTPGIAGAAAPPAWQNGRYAIVEAFSTSDAATSASSKTITNLQHNVLPLVQTRFINRIDNLGRPPDIRVTLGGVAPEDRDFVHAVYGKFPYVLAFVILLTFLLLMRAFRSILLPIKAVLLNLVSLGAAFGIIVFIFQQGHGSEAIWGVHATNSIISWIPLMIFAFLYGLSMDYEVFMVTRMREAYDETGDTRRAVAMGLARTGKLVTSAALVLMFAFFVLSTGPGVDIKQFGIGLAAGIIFDATVIRALLVPSIMRIAGKWNWWLPARVERVLLVARPDES